MGDTQINGNDELGWALDCLLDGRVAGMCPKAIARAHARLVRERADRDAYKAKAEEWERQVGEITDRLMTIVDDEIGVAPTAGPHESMDRIVAGLRAFRAEAEEWQARAEKAEARLRRPCDRCGADDRVLDASTTCATCVANMRVAVCGLAPHVEALRALADELHDGSPASGGRSGVARGAAHAIARALKAYDAAKTSEGSGACGSISPASGPAAVKAPEPLRASQPPEYNGLETYIPGLGVVRECIGCSCLVPGGPTRCRRCANEATCAKG